MVRKPVPRYNRKKPYQSRDEILKFLGFQSYGEYLKSDLWKSCRTAAMKRTNGICGCCLTSPATEVHHRTYDNGAMTGKCREALIPLCRTCHHSAEFDESGRKRRIQDANRLLLKWRNRKRKLLAAERHARSALGATYEPPAQQGVAGSPQGPAPNKMTQR